MHMKLGSIIPQTGAQRKEWLSSQNEAQHECASSAPYSSRVLRPHL